MSKIGLNFALNLSWKHLKSIKFKCLIHVDTLIKTLSVQTVINPDLCLRLCRFGSSNLRYLGWKIGFLRCVLSLSVLFVVFKKTLGPPKKLSPRKEGQRWQQMIFILSLTCCTSSLLVNPLTPCSCLTSSSNFVYICMELCDKARKKEAAWMLVVCSRLRRWEVWGFRGSSWAVSCLAGLISKLTWLHTSSLTELFSY